MNRVPRSFRIAVGTTLLALGGCASTEKGDKPTVDVDPDAADEKHVNSGPKVDKKPDEKQAEKPVKDFLDPDGDGIPNFSVNPGPNERDPKPEPEPQPEPEPKRVNVGPQ